MNKNNFLLSLFTLTIASLFTAAYFAGLFGPRSYEDCLLKHIDSTQPRAILQARRDICRMKFDLLPLENSALATEDFSDVVIPWADNRIKFE